MKNLLSSLVLAASFVSSPALAEWPERPITLVIAFEPGGGADQSTLPLKPLLEERLGQTLLMDYKPGAGGRIGFETVFMNGADGYTIGILTEPHFTNTTIFDTPRYGHEDLTPVGLFSRDVPIWFVPADSPIQDMNDLIEAARARPGEVTVAAGSFTGEQYLTLAILEQQADIQFRAVNVGGGGAVMTNVLGGHFEVGVIRPASLAGIADQVRAIGIVAEERSPLYPDTMTFDEQLPEDIRIPHFSSTRGMMVSTEWAESDPEGFARLEQALHEAIETDEYKEAMDRMGLPLLWLGSEEARAEMNATAEAMLQYRDLVEAATTR
jgi:tripartite-type tricarboxylate transporter receptor subunit TctC